MDHVLQASHHTMTSMCTAPNIPLHTRLQTAIEPQQPHSPLPTGLPPVLSPTMPFLRIGYKRLNYTDVKPSESSPIRETLILHHGLGSSQDYYGAVIPALVAHGYRCIAFDATGAGRSPYTQVEQSVESLAGDVLGVLDGLMVEKAVVVGHSMGGYVVSQSAM